MTSHSGESFVGEVELPPSTPMRCHTALGICSSSSSLSQEYISGESVESLADSGAVSATPGAILSPMAAGRLSADEAYQSGVTPNESTDENRNAVGGCFETVHEGQLLDANDKHGKGKNISGFLKKFTTSKKKRSGSSKSHGTGTL